MTARNPTASTRHRRGGPADAVPTNPADALAPKRKRGGRVHGEKAASRPDRRARGGAPARADGGDLPTRDLVPDASASFVPAPSRAVPAASLPRPEAKPWQNGDMKPGEMLADIEAVRKLSSDADKPTKGANTDPRGGTDKETDAARGGRILKRGPKR